MATVTLAELQQELQRYLLDQSNNMNELTVETPGFSRKERLEIYHEAYYLRLIDALGNDFPALKIFLSDENFTPMAKEYIEKFPSRHASLRWLGEKMPEFLRTHGKWKNDFIVYELAAFEWAQTMAFDAESVTLATLEDIRTLQNSQWLFLQLEFHPSLHLLDLQTNATEIWQSLIKDSIRPDVQVAPESTAWLVWRDDLQVVYKSISKPEYECLQQFLQHKNFSDVCEGLCNWFAPDQVPLKAAQYLQQWLQSGLIGRLITGDGQ